MTNSIPEFEENSNCFLIIGSNTSEGHPLIATRILKGQKRGAKVIVLDPRKNQIGHWADIYYSFRPGSDVALFNGLMNVIISEGLADEAFITERTEDYEALKTLEEALHIARSAGGERLIGQTTNKVTLYKRRSP